MSKLKKWYDEHESDPYLTKEEHEKLIMTTGLTVEQIYKWFAHERERRKKAAGEEITPNDRLPIAAVSELKKWYDKHESYSYPLIQAEEKAKLVMTTGLTETQVYQWLMRERRARQKDA